MHKFGAPWHEEILSTTLHEDYDLMKFEDARGIKRGLKGSWDEWKAASMRASLSAGTRACCHYLIQKEKKSRNSFLKEYKPGKIR